MAAETHAYDGATWRDLTTIWAYDGTWHVLTSLYAYDGTSWRLIFTGDPCDGITYTITSCTASNNLGGCASCSIGDGLQISWAPKSTCTNGYMRFYWSINGSSYTQFGSDYGCDVSDRYYYSGTGSYVVSATCTSACGAGCTSRQWWGKIELRANSDDSICETCIDGPTSTHYWCDCPDCGGP